MSFTTTPNTAVSLSSLNLDSSPAIEPLHLLPSCDIYKIQKSEDSATQSNALPTVECQPRNEPGSKLSLLVAGTYNIHWFEEKSGLAEDLKQLHAG